MPISWGGKDNYEYKFVSEICSDDEEKLENWNEDHQANNNSEAQANLNLMQKKVGQKMNL